MRSHFLTSVADQDIADIWQFIARDSIEAADRTIDRFTATFGSLAQNPYLGQAYEHPRLELRRSSVDKYAIFYRVLDDAIVVVRVLHGARNIDRLLE